MGTRMPRAKRDPEVAELRSAELNVAASGSDGDAVFKPVAATRKGNERIAALLEISRDIVLTEGLRSLTLRNVARTAGMRLFNLQHYFPTQADLLRATLTHTINGFMQAEAVRLRRLDTNESREAFAESCHHYLRVNRKPSTRQLFLDLAALAPHDEAVAEILRDSYVKYRTHFSAALRRFRPGLPESEIASRVEFMTSAIEGVMFIMEPREKFRAADSAAEKQFIAQLLYIAER